MTGRTLMSLFLRRWYLVALGAMLTVAGMYFTLQQPGVYWTKLTVILLAPADEYFPNKIQDPHYALAPMAGVLVKEWNRGHEAALTAGGDTTLFGMGKTDEVQVRMPNQGSQWNPLFLSPNIDVQVTGSDPEVVEKKALAVSDDLARILDRQQNDLGVNAKLRIGSVHSPELPTVYYVSGSRSRALGAVGLFGAISTFVIVSWLDRMLASGWRRRARPGGSGQAGSAPVSRPQASKEVDA